MDPDQFQELPTAPYPAPPPFWKHFTVENQHRIQQLRSHEEVSFELNFLRPPPAPSRTADIYTTFSASHQLDPTPALPPPEILLFDPNTDVFNHAQALKQLTNSLLLNFLELTTVLSNDPIKYEEKILDVQRLMYNVHFVINLYRPHQAREGVKEMLQEQLDIGHKEIEKCDQTKKKIEAYLSELGEQKATPAMNVNTKVDKSNIEDTKQIWNRVNGLKDD